MQDVSGQAFYQACSDLADGLANNRIVVEVPASNAVKMSLTCSFVVLKETSPSMSQVPDFRPGAKDAQLPVVSLVSVSRVSLDRLSVQLVASPILAFSI